MLKLLLGFVLISWHSFACENGKGFLPENRLRIPSSMKSGLTSEQYQEAIDRVVKIYAPVVKSQGAELVIERLWESDTVNAGTLRTDNGTKWVVRLYGGFARHPFITQDGYTLVICHEIGHHIGGAPKKISEKGPIWSSTEGQADYFATLKCLRKVFRQDDNIEVIKDMDIPATVRTECETSFKKDWEQALCMRTSMAGLSVAMVNADGRQLPMPSLEIVDPTVVENTQSDHPVPQCRLNTYFEGSICQVSSFKNVSQTDEVPGTCHEKENFTRGLRPACWFKSK